MPIVPTIKTLCRISGVDAQVARAIRKALKEGGSHDNPHWVQWGDFPPNPDSARHRVAQLLKTTVYHAWLAIRGSEWVSHYWQDTMALCLSRDDSYDETLIYDTERDRYIVCSFGDYIEQQENKGALLR